MRCAALAATLLAVGGTAHGQLLLAAPACLQQGLARVARYVSEVTGTRLRVAHDEEAAVLARVARGDAALGIVCREPGDGERAGLRADPLAHDGLAVIVNARNPIDNLALPALADVFGRPALRWREFGGADKPVVRVAVEGRRAPLRAVEERLHPGGRPAVGSQVVVGDLAAILFVAVDPYAIGYVGIGEAARLVAEGARVRPVPLHGMAPTPGVVRACAYPLSWPVYLVSSPRAAAPARRVRDFLLGPDGQRAIAEAGLAIPVRDQP